MIGVSRWLKQWLNNYNAGLVTWRSCTTLVVVHCFWIRYDRRD